MKILLILITALFANSTIAKKISYGNLTVYLIVLEQRLSETNSTPLGYNILLKKLLDDNINLKYTSQARAQRFVLNSKIACTFPASIAALSAVSNKFNGNDFIASEAVDKIGIRLYSHLPIKTLAELKGKSLLMPNGFDSSLMEKFEVSSIDYSDSELSRVKSLIQKRTDIVLSFSPDFNIALSKIPDEEIDKYDTKIELLSTTAHLICKKSNEARELINTFNSRLSKLKESGELSTILSPYANIIE